MKYSEKVEFYVKKNSLFSPTSLQIIILLNSLSSQAGRLPQICFLFYCQIIVLQDE